jgi:cytochrome P450
MEEQVSASAVQAQSATFEVKDLVQPEVIRNPYPWYALLRDQPPRFGLLDFPPGTIPGQDRPFPAWALLKYEDVAAAARDHDAFSSRDPMQEGSEAPTLMLVNHDRPRHTVLREIARQAFTPRRVEHGIAPWIGATVAEMVNELGEGEFDFMTSFAANLPARVMAHLIGTPQADYPLLRRWANAFMVTSDFTLEERNACNRQVGAYYHEAVSRRYAELARGQQAPDDLMTAFIQAEAEGQKLSKEEVVLFCITLVVAGAETTGYLLGNLVCTLVEEPRFFDLLKRDRTLVRPFIEESLRRDGPPQRLFRIATRDVQLGGASIAAGDWVALFYAAANRDPSVFPDPDQFILNRPNVGKQLTFGHGIHHCLGSGVARLEADRMINALLDKCSRIEPGRASMRRQSGGLLNYGLESCPIVLVR